jgi:hypothetical protein
MVFHRRLRRRSGRRREERSPAYRFLRRIPYTVMPAKAGIQSRSID